MTESDPFHTPPPERLQRWPRRIRCPHFGLPLSRGVVRVHERHWQAPLATVINVTFHDPDIVQAIGADADAPSRNLGLRIVKIGPDEVPADARALFRTRTRAELAGAIYYVSSAWVRGSGYVSRDDLIALLRAMTTAYREARPTWLFSRRPAALEPAPIEEALVRDLEARADRWDDGFLFECAALGLLDATAAEAKRRVLARLGLPRLVAVLDAAILCQQLVNDDERRAEVTWSWIAPPIAWRWLRDGVVPPEGCSIGRFLGACEAVWQRIPDRPNTPGASGEWIARVFGRRVALRWTVERGGAVLSGWRPARDDEPETPLLDAVDEAREKRHWLEVLRPFHGEDVVRAELTALGRSWLPWLSAQWAEVASSLGTAREDDLAPRRALLLREAVLFGLLSPSLRPPLMEDDALLRLHDAGVRLLAYLQSPERRAIVGYRFYGQVAGAWVSPVWFLRDEVARAGERAFELTARCEAALHGIHLGGAEQGAVSARIDGRAREVRWRRETSRLPSLCDLR